MIIKFTNYIDGIHEFCFNVKAKELGLPEEFTNGVQVEVIMDKSIHQIVLDCKLKSVALLNCDRCTESFNLNINTEFRLVYLFKLKIKDEGENLNLIYLSLDETKIDITEEVKEYCMLAIPLKLLCKEDCKGLCSSCGINLNLETCNCKKESYNPIWDKLNKLKE
ncbi:MAG TPA: DUF177 domain-containing protein [Melioribacteraceae bacterium]|nr:DUF177 domain-containing protein [Melioribacteraceae bacterium]